MERKNRDVLYFSQHESKVSECPVCGSKDLEWEKPELYDAAVEYPWGCRCCGAHGREVGTIVFGGHDVYDDWVPAQVQSAHDDDLLRTSLRYSTEDTERIPRDEGNDHITSISVTEVGPYVCRYEGEGTGCSDSPDGTCSACGHSSDMSKEKKQ